MSPESPDIEKPDPTKLYGIFLGFPFDQLLNQQCPYLVKSRKQGLDRQGSAAKNKVNGTGYPGIVLPDDKVLRTGSGNIVISGPPGSAKSTLALQFARACTQSYNQSAFPAYVSLENSPEEILAKAKVFGWDGFCRIVHSMQTAGEDLADVLRRVLTQPDRGDCPIQSGCNTSGGQCIEHASNLRKSVGESLDARDGHVLLVSLSPRPLAGREANDNVFWERYQQLERLLVAAATLRERAEAEHSNPNLDYRRILPVVVLDSLNMLAMRQLERNELATLFQLFRQHQTVGIFVVESTLDTPFDSTLADVVISLDMPDDEGYFVRRLKVIKSRYQQQVYGWHPLRTLPLQDQNAITPPIQGRDYSRERNERPRCGVVPYLSLHYVILRSGEYIPAAIENDRWTDPGKAWGVSALSHVLPSGLRDGSVFVVEGTRGTHQMQLAMTFLAKGMEQGKSAILIRLHDSPLLGSSAPKKEWPVLSREIEESTGGRGFWNHLELVEADGQPKQPIASGQPTNTGGGQAAWQNLIDPKKAIVTVWKMKDTQAHLFELDFKSGALLPEELVQAVWDVIIRRKEGEIERAVLDDVSEIGAAYPFLRKSSTSGETFLPALAHVMRNNRIDLVVTGTTGDLREGDEMIGRIRVVADSVLSCRHLDVFGKRHVIVEGEGSMARAQTMSSSQSSVPLVIQSETVGHGSDTVAAFDVSIDFLAGLVGFASGNVHRPGAVIHVFEENKGIHRRYNREIETMLRAALAFRSQSHKEPQAQFERQHSCEPADVVVFPFGSDLSEAVHHSLDVFQRGAPLDKTSICTVDEFGIKSERGEMRFVQMEEEFLKYEDIRKEVRRLLDGDAHADDTVRPYYLNVLLLAYDETAITSACTPTLKDPRGWKTWESLLKSFVIARKRSEVTRFGFDHSADETLCCALMDALSVGYVKAQGPRKAVNPSDEKVFGELLGCYEDILVRGKNGSHALPEGVRREIKALYELLSATGEAQFATEEEYRTGGSGHTPTVQLCWYSQLRELIADNPRMADNLAVCALPGFGFTGDWFIGVVRGSVSEELGRSIIELLCSEEEDSKRYTRGVGLPVTDRFYREDLGYYAWPRGRSALQKGNSGGASLSNLSYLGAIHKLARSRARIEKYASFRSALGIRAMQLTRRWGELPSNRKELRERIDDLVVGLLKQIKDLQGAAS